MLYRYYCSYDANFPHGVPDPECPLFLEDLKAKVLENKADVGFGFDTDGDRFGFVDEKGNSYPADRTLLLFARDVLKENPGGTVIYDVKCSKVLDDVIPDLGGNPEMIRTGHPYFVQENHGQRGNSGSRIFRTHVFCR